MPRRWPRPDDEAFFQDALDARPADNALRLLFSSWLAERGDWRAGGYAWMARCDKVPAQELMRAVVAPTWDWWSMQPGWKGQRGDVNNRPDRLAPELFDLLDGYAKKSRGRGGCSYCEFFLRRDAEEALCRALFKFESMQR